MTTTTIATDLLEAVEVARTNVELVRLRRAAGRCRAVDVTTAEYTYALAVQRCRDAGLPLDDQEAAAP